MSTTIEKISAGGVSIYNASQLELIRRTVAKDTTLDEFSMFIEVCRRTGLDPFRRQIYAVVYNKDNPDKRRMVIIIGIDGLRAIAARNRDYRPDDEPPVFEIDESAKSPINPVGIVSCTVRCWKQAKDGQWHKASGTMYWDEFVPTSDVMKTNESGRWVKDDDGDYIVERRRLSKTSNWYKMPRVMAAKVAEAIALRKGWPEDLGDLYAEEEMDRARAVEELARQKTAAEELDDLERVRREAKIGGPSFIFMFSGDEPLTAVPRGQAADRLIERLSAMSAESVEWFEARNADALKQLWAFDKDAALAVKRHIETLKKQKEKV